LVSDALVQIRTHFESVYGRKPSNLAATLFELLPEELRHPRVARLQCSSFLVERGLVRLERRALAAVRRLPGGMVDLGCGTGGLGRRIARRIGSPLVGVDVAISGGAAREGFIVGDMHDLPLSDSTFSLAIANDVLHLVEEPVLALRETHRVLAPQATLIGSLYRYGGSVGRGRTREQWERVFGDAGFRRPRLFDVTREWRAVMTAKHQARWSHRESLVRRFGPEAALHCDVSRQMLGIDMRIGFIAANERWEVIVRK